MTITPGLRKLALTAHVTSSVGWLGAVAGFLVLAIAGLTGENTQTVRAAYLAMNLTAWCVIVPLSLASPLTGIVQSLGTSWGLLRHYWIVVKLVITIPATILLLLHMQPSGHLARVVAETTLVSGELGGMRIKLVANAAVALVVLLAATTLSIYKPWGLTRYGRRKQHEQFTGVASVLPHLSDFGMEARPGSTTGTPRWVFVFWISVIVLVLLFVILHLTGGGLGHHTP